MNKNEQNYFSDPNTRSPYITRGGEFETGKSLYIQPVANPPNESEGTDLFSYYVKEGLDDTGKVIFNETRQAWYIARMHEVAKAIRYLHKCGLMHRDIKLENVIICKNNDNTDKAVVCDYDCLKAFSEEDGSNTPTGSLAYMHPTVPEGEYGPYVDWFSYAVMLCVIFLNVRNPFAADGLYEGISQKPIIDNFVQGDQGKLVDRFQDAYAFHDKTSKETKLEFIELLQVCCSSIKLSGRDRETTEKSIISWPFFGTEEEPPLKKLRVAGRRRRHPSTRRKSRQSRSTRVKTRPRRRTVVKRRRRQRQRSRSAFLYTTKH